MNKVLVILGPTATGKTDLALQLARQFAGELVSVDSRQVYAGLDIGTGKISNFKFQISNFSKHKNYWEVDGVKIWMYDVADPNKQYTVYDYVKDADRVIGDIKERGKLPIVVGGTGLYLKALLEGLPNLAIPVDKKLRKQLNKLTVDQLQEKLKNLSFERWQKMNDSDRQNSRRLVRAIELSLDHIDPRSRLPRHFVSCNDVLRIGLTAPRDILYERVDERVVSRINQGMIEEAKRLHESGLTYARMKQLGLEYGVLADYLSGAIREIEGDWGLIKIVQNKIHGFVRRQLTWFNKEKNVVWFDIISKNYPKKLENLVTRWYH
ncbi:tRNA (adenosine(37)-N6)-dimethylallyltransferase MiaA [Candidatus Daviesbacteria bacterium]|nr:tRNA (adenosine(37)-N6)-dimethylallyltransferase MiaA [Candidatus Daviesbacteria bacterium]